MLKARLANLDDSKDIFSWRHDIHTQKMSLQKKIFSIKEHENWFLQQINDKNILILILETHKNDKVGVVRFNTNNNIALISINISPPMRGKRLAKKCIELSIKYFERIYPSIKTVQAQILPINIPSIISFEKAGFIFKKTKKGINYYHYSKN